jgi:hypothetical protein
LHREEYACRLGILTKMQSISWYVGLVQAGAALLTVVIYVLVYMRKKSKNNLDQQLRLSGFQNASQ